MTVKNKAVLKKAFETLKKFKTEKAQQGAHMGGGPQHASIIKHLYKEHQKRHQRKWLVPKKAQQWVAEQQRRLLKRLL